VSTAAADIPVTYRDAPVGFASGWATNAEMASSGFEHLHEAGETPPGAQPLDEHLVEGVQMISPEVAAQLMRAARVPVLRDPVGRIVATWDEGRWWTPDESAEFLRRIVAEINGGES